MFRAIRDITDAYDTGTYAFAAFRKVPPSAATIAGQWFDYSMAAGSPVPQYYASSPLVSKTLDSNKGIFLPLPAQGGYIQRACAMSGAASATSITNANQTILLLDYLLYYPFIDMDVVGEEQPMEQGEALLRYPSGRGVMMMAVAQAPTAGGGSFVVRYKNQNGEEKTTPTITCAAAQPMGALVQAVSAAAGVVPFIPLASGDSGVQEVLGVTMNAGNGGLMAIVLVKPILSLYVREESRRTTSSPFASFGDAAWWNAILMGPPAKVEQGAFLSFIGLGAAGSLASSQLVGYIEVVWR